MLNVQKIKLLHRLKGMTQSDFADALNITQSYLSYLLNGKRKGSIEIVSNMAKVLGVRVDELVIETPGSPFFQMGMSRRRKKSKNLKTNAPPME